MRSSEYESLTVPLVSYKDLCFMFEKIFHCYYEVFFINLSISICFELLSFYTEVLISVVYSKCF